MGRGDYILFADAHFPAYSLGPKVIRADGLRIDDLLRGLILLFELDRYVEHPVLMMAPVKGDHLDAEYVTISYGRERILEVWRKLINIHTHWWVLN